MQNNAIRCLFEQIFATFSCIPINYLFCFLFAHDIYSFFCFGLVYYFARKIEVSPPWRQYAWVSGDY